MPTCYSRFGPLVLLAGLASACAPTYQLGLRPAQPTGLFSEGAEQARAVAADSVEVRLSFVCYEPTRVVFEAVYRNPSRQALVVDPTAFRYEVRRELLPTAAAGQPRGSRPRPLPGASVTAAVAAASLRRPLPPLPAQAIAAFDPEPEITMLRATSDRHATNAARPDWLGLVLTTAAIASDVVSVNRRETPGRAGSRVAIRDVALTYNTAASAARIGHVVAAEALHQRARQLEDYALRKVTLAPGQQVRGYLYFPRYDAADVLVVQAPVGRQAVPLEFVQLRRRVK